MAVDRTSATAREATNYRIYGRGLSFELEPKGNNVLFTVIHRRLPDRGTIMKVGPGWHMHLDVLVARMTGKKPEPFWDGISRLKKEYDRRLPA